MKSVKLLALGALLVFGTACSKSDDSGCEPTAKATVFLEQGYSLLGSSVYQPNKSEKSAYVRFEMLKSGEAEEQNMTDDPDFQSAFENMPSFEITESNGDRYIGMEGKYNRLEASDISDRFLKLGNGMDSISNIKIPKKERKQIVAMLRKQLGATDAQICSTSVAMELAEKTNDDSSKVLVMIFKFLGKE